MAAAPQVSAARDAVEGAPRRVTLAEFLSDSTERGALSEWVNGEVVVHLAATPDHQRVVRFLLTLLQLFCELFRRGEVLSAPCLMLLAPDGPGREPDVMFVATANRERVGPSRVDGAADIAVEVVSDDSVARDRAEKFYEYERAGVREYWLIDPRPESARADFWVLSAEGRYDPVPVGADGVYRSQVLEGFWLRTAWLRATPAPDTLQCLAEIAALPAGWAATAREAGSPSTT